MAEQLAGERLPLVWQPQDVPQPASEAAVSSYRQQRKLAGLHLADACAVALPEVRLGAARGREDQGNCRIMRCSGEELQAQCRWMALLSIDLWGCTDTSLLIATCSFRNVLALRRLLCATCRAARQ